MELYLIRHGIAQEQSLDIKDEERCLTFEGQEKTQKVAKRLYNLGLKFELILTSPLERSRQTAEILRECGLSSKIEAASCLAPEGDIQSWLGWLEERQMRTNDTQVALVGHEPNLGQWAEILVWGIRIEDNSKDTSAAPNSRFQQPVIVLKKAGIIGLKLPKTGSIVGYSQLFWLAPPKFLL